MWHLTAKGQFVCLPIDIVRHNEELQNNGTYPLQLASVHAAAAGSASPEAGDVMQLPTPEAAGSC